MLTKIIPSKVFIEVSNHFSNQPKS